MTDRTSVTDMNSIPKKILRIYKTMSILKLKCNPFDIQTQIVPFILNRRH
ncbi:hypothetical protein HanIR_Chr07g0324811 [Helianthus annuus]|nr:hypothetical protein HanIR_Chr07g0324811 [Helianthus annuus]